MSARSFAVPAVAAAAVALTGAAVLLQPRPAGAQAQKLPVLHYLNFPGLGFAIRAALHHGKIEFTDVRHDMDGLNKMRGGPEGSNAQVPLGKVPVLVMPDGHVACQSNSILRWAGKKTGLYPTDNDDHAQLVDEVLDTVGEFFNKVPQSQDAAELKRLREEYIAGDFAKHMRYFNMRLEQHASGPFVLGSQISVVDLKLANLVSWLVSGKMDHISDEHVKRFPAVWKHYEATIAHPIYANQMERELKIMSA